MSVSLMTPLERCNGTGESPAGPIEVRRLPRLTAPHNRGHGRVSPLARLAGVLRPEPIVIRVPMCTSEIPVDHANPRAWIPCSGAPGFEFCPACAQTRTVQTSA